MRLGAAASRRARPAGRRPAPPRPTHGCVAPPRQPQTRRAPCGAAWQSRWRRGCAATSRRACAAGRRPAPPTRRAFPRRPWR
eukprot:scaffold45972_cov59-Phaeocystis_antarctica.AAC.4